MVQDPSCCLSFVLVQGPSCCLCHLFWCGARPVVFVICFGAGPVLLSLSFVLVQGTSCCLCHLFWCRARPVVFVICFGAGPVLLSLSFVWDESNFSRSQRLTARTVASIPKKIKGAVPFQLRLPFVICSVSILVDTASSVLAPLKAGWNCANSFMHEQYSDYFLLFWGLKLYCFS
jgi:hypothetical protein